MPYVLSHYPEATEGKSPDGLALDFDFSRSFEGMKGAENPKAFYKQVIRDLAVRIAQVGTHFCGAPFVLAARAVVAGTGFGALTWSHGAGERIWLIPRSAWLTRGRVLGMFRVQLH
jgi:hypothetical protein